MKDGKMTLNFDKEIVRKLWDNYYVPYVKDILRHPVVFAVMILKPEIFWHMWVQLQVPHFSRHR